MIILCCLKPLLTIPNMCNECARAWRAEQDAIAAAEERDARVAQLLKQRDRANSKLRTVTKKRDELQLALDISLAGTQLHIGGIGYIGGGARGTSDKRPRCTKRSKSTNTEYITCTRCARLEEDLNNMSATLNDLVNRNALSDGVDGKPLIKPEAADASCA